MPMLILIFKITGVADKVAEAKEGLHEKVKELEKEEEDRVSFDLVYLKC